MRRSPVPQDPRPDVDPSCERRCRFDSVGGFGAAPRGRGDLLPGRYQSSVEGWPGPLPVRRHHCRPWAGAERVCVGADGAVGHRCREGPRGAACAGRGGAAAFEADADSRGGTRAGRGADPGGPGGAAGVRCVHDPTRHQGTACAGHPRADTRVCAGHRTDAEPQGSGDPALAGGQGAGGGGAGDRPQLERGGALPGRLQAGLAAGDEGPGRDHHGASCQPVTGAGEDVPGDVPGGQREARLRLPLQRTGSVPRRNIRQQRVGRKKRAL